MTIYLLLFHYRSHGRCWCQDGITTRFSLPISCPNYGNWFWKNFEILISRKKRLHWILIFTIFLPFFIGWCWTDGFENWKSSGHVERRCLLTWRIYHYSRWPIRTEWNSRLHDEGCWGCGQKMSSTWFLKWKNFFRIYQNYLSKNIYIYCRALSEKKKIT